MSEENQRIRQFKKFFIGLILFIIFVIVVLLYTGRGSLA